MKILEELKSRVAPPEEPYVRIGDSDWVQVFAVFGTRLPQEFVQLYKSYGDGYFYSLTHKNTANLTIYGSGSFRWGMNNFVPNRLNELRILKENHPKKVPAPLFWEPSGLLPCGLFSNNTDLCWIAKGELVDKWQVATLHTASNHYEEYDCSMIEFLIGILSGNIEGEFLPKGFPGKKGVAFEGWKYGKDINS